MYFRAKNCGAESLRIPERYLLSLTLTYSLSIFVLSFYTGATLDIYISVFIIEYFVVTLVHSPLEPKTRKITNFIGYTLFAVFVLIVAIKVLAILGATFI